MSVDLGVESSGGRLLRPFVLLSLTDVFIAAPLLKERKSTSSKKHILILHTAVQTF